MPFITQGKTNLIYILIVVVLAVIVGGGILGYQYLWMEKQEKAKTSDTVITYNTFEEVFAEVKNIPKSTLPDFIEEPRLFTLRGKIIKETHVTSVSCLVAPRRRI